MGNWIRVDGLVGVRYREHPERKYMRRPDRYFSIRYKDRGGKTREEGVGWASDGYTARTASDLRARIMQRADELGRTYTLAELRREHCVETEEEITRYDLERVRFADVAARYLDWARCNKRSWRADQSRLSHHLLPFLGHLPLDEITPVTIEALRRELQGKTGKFDPKAARPLSVATINQCLLLASRIFRQAQLMPLHADAPHVPVFSGANPCAQIRRQRVDNARWRILTTAQTDAILLLAADTARLPVRKVYRSETSALVFHDAILFALHTGARLVETCSLRWQFVDLDRNATRLVETKSGRDRTVFADEACLDMLRRRAARPAEQTHVFWDEGTPLTGDRMSHIFTWIARELGLNDGFTRAQDKIVFHSLRHTYGTRAIMSGMSVLTLKQLMGHRTLETTERYVHLAEEFLRGEALR